MTYKGLKQIWITEDNYQIVKGFGKAGDSYNDAFNRILEKAGVRVTTTSSSRSNMEKQLLVNA